MYRQGDVSLHPVAALPTTAQKVKDPVLAYGEATGHQHRVVGDQVCVFADGDGQKFVEVGDSGARLVHDFAGGSGVTAETEAREKDLHVAQELKPGLYAVKIEREYDPFEDVLRQVTD